MDITLDREIGDYQIHDLVLEHNHALQLPGTRHLMQSQRKISTLQAFEIDTADVMTHKYRGCIAVLSINKSVEPNEEQKVLTSSFNQGFSVNTSRQVFRGF